MFAFQEFESLCPSHDCRLEDCIEADSLQGALAPLYSARYEVVAGLQYKGRVVAYRSAVRIKTEKQQLKKLSSEERWGFFDFDLDSHLCQATCSRR